MFADDSVVYVHTTAEQAALKIPAAMVKRLVLFLRVLV